MPLKSFAVLLIAGTLLGCDAKDALNFGKVLGSADTTKAEPTDSKGSAWDRFFTSLKVEPVQPGRRISLRAGDAVRFGNTTSEWCGDRNTGIRVITGNGTTYDQDPMAEGVKMNTEGSYGMVHTTGVTATSFFVASYTPTVLELVIASSEVVGPGCGE